MTSSRFGILPRSSASSAATATQPPPLRSCLRRGRIGKCEAASIAHSSLASTASATTSTPMSSQLHCELPADDCDHGDLSPARIRADAFLSQREAQHNNCSERQFMELSHHLVTAYNRGLCRSPSDAKRILHQLLPTFHQRRDYHSSLIRNFAVLPMFPEPGEHLSFSMTRCVHRVFGLILDSEMNCGRRETMSRPEVHKSSPNVVCQSGNYASLEHRQCGGEVAASLLVDGSPPLGMDGEAMFPAPTEGYPIQYQQKQQQQQQQQQQFDSYTTQQFHPTQQFSPTSPNSYTSLGTPRDSEGNARPISLTVQTTATATSPTNKSLFNETAPMHASISPTSQSYPSLLSAARQSYFNVHTPPPISSLHQSTNTVHPTHSPPPPEPLTFFSKSPTNHPKIDLTSPSHEIVAQLSTARMNNDSNNYATKSSVKNHNTNNISVITTNIPEETIHTRTTAKDHITPKSFKDSSQYQRLNSQHMLPPILTREDVLYYPISKMPPSSPCCFNDNASSLTHPRQKRRPSYLQLYVKCEWSEPFLQPESGDIITYYKNRENQVTADRTLVVCGTTSLFELIKSILISFGLFDEINDDNEVEVDTTPSKHGTTADLLSSLGCHNQVCFVSDVKSSCTPESSFDVKLTPLPIPGFYYKYVPRGMQQPETIRGGDGGATDKNGSTVLSTDPVILQRTLISQILDTPLFLPDKTNKPSRGRTRLALVHCTKKRHAYLSSRTLRAVLLELIYHFQIVLEGIVDEEELPSSFQTQIPVRCVSGIGGVQGGNLIDDPHEVKELNRKLWGKRDVVGLVSPSSNPAKNREKIIDVLSTPLFDTMGNQALKEGVVERALYQISSGQLSMKIAKRTQGTVDTCIGSTDWLARQVGSVAECVSKKANACMDEDVLNEYDQKLEALVTRVML